MIQQDETQDYKQLVTSRRTLPASRDDMADLVWFNMWQRRLWPYRELAVGTVLYWYESSSQAIVWKTHVSDVDRFEYENKGEARQRLGERFDVDAVDDPYFIKAPDRGYFLAYQVTMVERLNVPKPYDYKFPQGGWLRCDDPNAKTWLLQLRRGGQDGSYTDQVWQSAMKATNEGYFEPQNREDERERRLREIVQRRGQPEFRDNLIRAYGGRCAITGCEAIQTLEAAHITPYLGRQSNDVSNGLLLRADMHTLFDLDLIGIEPKLLQVVLAEELHGTCYEEIKGRRLSAPGNPALGPSREALKERWERFIRDG